MERIAHTSSPWTSAFGVVRTLLALTILLTLMFTSADALFRPLSATVSASNPSFWAKYGLFGLFDRHLEAARWLGILGLSLVASGYRPRVTGVLQWWITTSFVYACIPADGGDQVASVLTLILLPAALLDPRRWHWGKPPVCDGLAAKIAVRVANSSVAVARFQVAAIYLHAAVGKTGVREWANGTAIYYWLIDPRIGLPARYTWVALLLTRSPYSTALLTWGPILLEFALFLAVATPSHHWCRKPLLVLGLIFHFGNILFFGLVSFFIVMSAALLLLVWPLGDPIRLDNLIAFARYVTTVLGLSAPATAPSAVDLSERAARVPHSWKNRESP